MNKKLLIAGMVGLPVGMVLTTALHGIGPFFVRLPGGGQRCSKCHDLHGGVRFGDLKADGWIHLTGDVPQPTWIDTAGLFRSHHIDGLPGVAVRDLLAEHGCSEFHRVVFISADGGHVAVGSDDLTESARLVPHLNAARLADERLHESAWLRAIVQICVVADKPVIELNGHRTTFGTLLAGARTTVLTEPARASQKEESTGRRYRNVASRLMTGVHLLGLIEPPGNKVVVTADGQTLSFDADQVRDAVICRDRHDGRVLLVLPRKSRDRWPTSVTAIEWKRPPP